MPARQVASPPTDRPDAYPQRGARNGWILSRRQSRPPRDPWRPHGWFLEWERTESGVLAEVATVLLTNRECPWKCVMCDLWKTTVTETVPPGAIPAQIDHALAELARQPLAATVPTPALPSPPSTPVPKVIKLYNGGSFFDPGAIPVADYEAIAARVAAFDRVVVECHPAFVGNRTLDFRNGLARANQRQGIRESAGPIQLEVAMGLETAHPETLEKLNKGMTLQQFAKAADFLRRHQIALRVFVLVHPPFLEAAQAEHWARRSVDLAFELGATVVSIIPTRDGNGAMDALRHAGQFTSPSLAQLESVLEYGVGLVRGRVFADLWDLERFARCGQCFSRRRERLRLINQTQAIPESVPCPACSVESFHSPSQAALR